MNHINSYNMKGKFVILKDDGTSIDVTDKTEDAFAMMTKPLDDLFSIEIERD